MEEEVEEILNVQSVEMTGRIFGKCGVVVLTGAINQVQTVMYILLTGTALLA